MRAVIVSTGEYFLVWFRGITQNRTRIVKARLATQAAFDIENAINAGLDGGWLAEGGITAWMLVDQKKSTAVLGAIDSLCCVERLGDEFLASLDAKMRG